MDRTIGIERDHHRDSDWSGNSLDHSNEHSHGAAHHSRNGSVLLMTILPIEFLDLAVLTGSIVLHVMLALIVVATLDRVIYWWMSL